MVNRDVTTGATEVAPKFPDTLTLSQLRGADFSVITSLVTKYDFQYFLHDSQSQYFFLIWIIFVLIRDIQPEIYFHQTTNILYCDFLMMLWKTFWGTFQYKNSAANQKNCFVRGEGNYFLFLFFFFEKQCVNSFFLLGNSFFLLETLFFY